MKKVIASILIIILMLGLTSCTPVELHGLDSYSQGNSTVTTTAYLFPSVTFINDFEYETGDYFYFDSCNYFEGPYETALAYLKYSPETYEDAKNYCLEKFLLADETREYNGYTFVENTQLSKHYLEGIATNEERYRFPRHFNMFAYNDENCTLVFLGYCNDNRDHAEADKELALTDFGAFIDKTYSEYFSYSTVTDFARFRGLSMSHPRSRAT